MYDEMLMHYGILGMKWGVRRYQNEDGSLTDAGKRRYQAQQQKEDRERHKTVLLQERAKRAELKSTIQKAKQQEQAIKEARQRAKEAKAEAKKQKQEEKAVKSGQRMMAIAAVNDRRLASKRRGTLSDAELQKRIERLQQEKTLKSLTDEQYNRGRSLLNDVMSDAGKKVLTTALTGAGIYVLSKAVGMKGDAFADKASSIQKALNSAKDLTKEQRDDMEKQMAQYMKNSAYWNSFGDAIFNGGPKKK